MSNRQAQNGCTEPAIERGRCQGLRLLESVMSHIVVSYVKCAKRPLVRSTTLRALLIFHKLRAPARSKRRMK